MSKPDWKPAFLEFLAHTPMPTYAARHVGQERSTVYRARMADPEFAEAWKDAEEQGMDRAEREAYRRGVEGVAKPVIFGGQLTYEVERDANGAPVMVEVEDVSFDHENKRQVRKRMVEKLVMKDGKPVPIVIREYSDMMLTLMLKGRRKQVFSERTEITGADGGAIDVNDQTARSQRMMYLLELGRRRSSNDHSDLA